MIRRSSETLYVHPLPTHLAAHVRHRQLEKPHIVVKKSIKSSSGNCAKINSYYSLWNSNLNLFPAFWLLIILTLDALLYFHLLYWMLLWRGKEIIMFSRSNESIEERNALCWLIKQVLGGCPFNRRYHSCEIWRVQNINNYAHHREHCKCFILKISPFCAVGLIEH